MGLGSNLIPVSGTLGITGSLSSPNFLWKTFVLYHQKRRIIRLLKKYREWSWANSPENLEPHLNIAEKFGTPAKSKIIDSIINIQTPHTPSCIKGLRIKKNSW